MLIVVIVVAILAGSGGYAISQALSRNDHQLASPTTSSSASTGGTPGANSTTSLPSTPSLIPSSPTPSPTPSSVPQKTIPEHLTLHCINCDNSGGLYGGGFPGLAATIDSVVIDQGSGQTIFNFTLTNNSTEICGSAGFSTLTLEDPAGTKTDATGPGVANPFSGNYFTLDKGQSLQESPVFTLIPQSGVQYKLYVKLDCINGYGNQYRTEVLQF